MGYGCDISQIKLWYPGSEVHGIDKNIVMTDDVREKGINYTYGRAKEVVKEGLGKDMLGECNFDQGDAMDLGRYPKDRFNHVISFSLIHHLDEEDRERVFSEAYKVLDGGGVLNAGGISGELLEPFVHIKGRYDWDKVAETRYQGTERVKNPNMDPELRRQSLSDIDMVCEDMGLDPTEHDKSKVEMVAGIPSSFRITGLTPEKTEALLRNIGYRNVLIKDYSQSSHFNIVSYLKIFAEK